jgi:hypothetical protein
VPIHYGHNAQVLGLEAASQFQQALTEISPTTTAQVLTLGETRSITV